MNNFLLLCLDWLQRACVDLTVWEKRITAEQTAEPKQDLPYRLDHSKQKEISLVIINQLSELLVKAGQFGEMDKIYIVAYATKLFLIFRDYAPIADDMTEILNVLAPGFKVDDLRT